MESFHQIRILLFPAPVELAALADHLVLVSKVIPTAFAEILLYECSHFVVEFNVFRDAGVFFYVFIETGGFGHVEIVVLFAIKNKHV